METLMNEKKIPAQLVLDELFKQFPDGMQIFKENADKALKISPETVSAMLYVDRKFFLEMDPLLCDTLSKLLDKSELGDGKWGQKLSGYLQGRFDQGKQDGKF